LTRGVDDDGFPVRFEAEGEDDEEAEEEEDNDDADDDDDDDICVDKVFDG
jgi:hypothetical protein